MHEFHYLRKFALKVVSVMGSHIEIDCRCQPTLSTKPILTQTHNVFTTLLKPCNVDPLPKSDIIKQGGKY